MAHMPKDRCQKCNNDTIITIWAAAEGEWGDPGLSLEYKGKEYVGRTPKGFNLGNNPDTLEISYCFYCGQMQGKFPIDPNIAIEEMKNG